MAHLMKVELHFDKLQGRVIEPITRLKKGVQGLLKGKYVCSLEILYLPV